MNMDIKQLSTSELERELAARKAKDQAEAKPKPLPNPDFKALQDTCVAAINKIESEGDPEGDCKHWIYESAMTAVFGKDVWTWIRTKNC